MSVRVWPQCAVRAAGFPVDLVAGLLDPGLAEAASSAGTSDGELEELYAAARFRSTRRLLEIAAAPSFREAVTWQNPQLVRNWLGAVDPAALTQDLAGTAKMRKRVLTLAGYVQRYAAKNDTIGFFGPVGWATWTGGAQALEVVTGPTLLESRQVYFETWGIDALVDTLARDPVLAGGLRPRVARHLLVGQGGVTDPQGRDVAVTDDELAVLRACDGVRTTDELAELLGPVAGCADVVRTLGERGLLRAAPEVVPSAHPEQALDELLAASTVPAHARLRADLAAARAAVADAAGDPERLLAAIDRLEAVFEDAAQHPATRRAGQAYAGRTLVYEDARRSGHVHLGEPLWAALEPPLGLLLRAAAWLVGQAAQTWRRELGAVLDRMCARRGATEVPLGAFLSAITPLLQSSAREVPPVLDGCVEELQRRWAQVVALAPDQERPVLTTSQVADLVDELFPPCPVPWARAVHHSPDLMLAAAGVDAVARGEFLLVLGELHVAVNTLEARPFVEQSPSPDVLRAQDRRDHAGRRVVLVPSKSSMGVSSRTTPSALLAADDLYVSWHGDDAIRAPDALPAASLRVTRREDALVVRSVLDDRELDLLEVLGEVLSATVINAFSLVPAGRHLPRTTIDRLVVQRESWSFEVGELEWAVLRDPARRFREACLWWQRHGLPPRCFAGLPGEEKPVLVDVRSIALLELFARLVRTTGDASSRVTLTEMLPDLDEAWLRDGDGNAFTAELRVVALAPDGC